MTSRQLLILDLDETLIYASDGEPLPDADFAFDRFSVLRRPYVAPFLARVAEWFDLAVWTSSSQSYASRVVDAVFPDPRLLKFFWCHDRCTPRYDPETQDYFRSKNLLKVKRRGYALERVLMIDDSPEKLARHYGNYIRVRPFTGDEADSELRDLLPFLEWIRCVPNVRTVEKRHWRARSSAAE